MLPEISQKVAQKLLQPKWKLTCNEIYSKSAKKKSENFFLFLSSFIWSDAKNMLSVQQK